MARASSSLGTGLAETIGMKTPSVRLDRGYHPYLRLPPRPWLLATHPLLGPREAQPLPEEARLRGRASRSLPTSPFPRWSRRRGNQAPPVKVAPAARAPQSADFGTQLFVPDGPTAPPTVPLLWDDLFPKNATSSPAAAPSAQTSPADAAIRRGSSFLAPHVRRLSGAAPTRNASPCVVHPSRREQTERPTPPRVARRGPASCAAMRAATSRAMPTYSVPSEHRTM